MAVVGWSLSLQKHCDLQPFSLTLPIISKLTGVGLLGEFEAKEEQEVRKSESRGARDPKKST